MDQFLSEILNNGQINPVLIAPVLFVFFGAILVFVFGFKKPVEPQFNRLSTSDASKKVKRKEKSHKIAQNGNVITNPNKSGDQKKHSGVEDKNKKEITTVKKQLPTKKEAGSPKKSEEKKLLSTQNKKQIAKQEKEKVQRKELAAEIDDGEWMTVMNRTDKKKKSEEAQFNLESPKKKSQSPGTEEKKESKQKGQKQGKELKNKKDSPESKKEIVATIENNAEIQQENVEEHDIVKNVPSIEEDISSASKEVKKADILPEVATADPEGDTEESTDKENPITETKIPESNIVFDELGDAWTEAKTPRKSKKRSRLE